MWGRRGRRYWPGLEQGLLKLEVVDDDLIALSSLEKSFTRGTLRAGLSKYVAHSSKPSGSVKINIFILAHEEVVIEQDHIHPFLCQGQDIVQVS